MNVGLNRKRPLGLDRRGTVLVLCALLLVLFLACCAFAVDLGNTVYTRTALSAAADSGALAAAGSLTQDGSLDSIRAVAVRYGNKNVPDNYGVVVSGSNVTFGVWDPIARTFTADNFEPNAVRVVAERSQAQDNPMPYFFGKIFGKKEADVSATAVAVGATWMPSNWVDTSVYVTSTKDLSNVVLMFCDWTVQKFDDLDGYTGTFEGTGENEGKEICGVWIKSGCNKSGDGPGYGEKVRNRKDGETRHGRNRAEGCTPHVTATFGATGPKFTESGSTSPVRLVQ